MVYVSADEYEYLQKVGLEEDSTVAKAARDIIHGSMEEDNERTKVTALPPETVEYLKKVNHD